VSNYPNLEQVVGGYFHQDAEGGPEGSLREYVADGAERAAAALAEVEALLAAVPDEAGLEKCADRLGNAWDVPRFGMTYREFFERVRDVLREHAG
jgi:hypothetical protein